MRTVLVLLALVIPPPVQQVARQLRAEMARPAPHATARDRAQARRALDELARSLRR